MFFQQFCSSHTLRSRMASGSTIYQPLRTSEIRLMRVHISKTDSIQCSLSTFAIDKLPKYIALSYRWGEDQPSHGIHVYGVPVLVQSNLYDYLQLLKEETQEDWYFIDYVCINQKDIVERGQQVAHMRQIYGRASEVVAWMGMKADLRSGFPEGVVENYLNTLQTICNWARSTSALTLFMKTTSEGLNIRELNLVKACLPDGSDSDAVNRVVVDQSTSHRRSGLDPWMGDARVQYEQHFRFSWINGFRRNHS